MLLFTLIHQQPTNRYLKMLNLIILITTILLFICVFKGVKADLKRDGSSDFSANFQAFCLTFITVLGLAIFAIMAFQAIK